jgi:hypothetical protein
MPTTVMGDLVSSVRKPGDNPGVSVGDTHVRGRTQAGSVGAAGLAVAAGLAAYKTELINGGKPWRSIEQVELATAAWVSWFNQERLHEALGYMTPAEYEAALTGASHPASQPTPALATTSEQNLG